MEIMLQGAIATTSLVASLFFLRFWKQTQDRFFLYFALSFLIDMVTRIVLANSTVADEHEPLYFVPRLIAFGLIIWAVVDINRRGKPQDRRSKDI
jgi:hypothetical protein